MDRPVYKKAYEPWDRAPGEDVPWQLREIWYQTAIGVLLLNTTAEVQDAAAHQADETVRRQSSGIRWSGAR